MTDQNTVSIPLSELTLEQLVQLSQGIGHEIEKLRAKRAYLRGKINERLAVGERTSMELRDDVAESAGGDAQAPGATITVSAAPKG